MKVQTSTRPVWRCGIQQAVVEWTGGKSEWPKIYSWEEDIPHHSQGLEREWPRRRIDGRGWEEQRSDDVNEQSTAGDSTSRRRA